VKLHTLLDLRGAIPTFIHISDGKMHDVDVLDLLLIEPGAFYIMDREYLDFERLYALDSGGRILRHARQAKPRCATPVLMPTFVYMTRCECRLRCRLAAKLT